MHMNAGDKKLIQIVEKCQTRARASTLPLVLKVVPKVVPKCPRKNYSQLGILTTGGRKWVPDELSRGESI
jgi:hypothetical protein